MINPLREFASKAARSKPGRALVLGSRRLAFSVRVQRLGERSLQRVMTRLPQMAEWITRRLEPVVTRVTKTVRVGPSGEVMPPVAAVTREELLSQLQAARTWQGKVQLLTALSAFDDALALAAVSAALRDTSVEVASAAIATLGVYDNPASRAALHEVFDNPQSYYHPLSRAAALLALAQSREPSEQAHVRAALRDSAAEVSMAAIAVLSQRASQADLDALTEVARDGTGFFLPSVRAEALRGIERAELRARVDHAQPPHQHTRTGI